MILSACADDPPPRVEVGKRLPVLEVELLDGGSFQLAPSRDEIVLVNFWASWCVPCRAEIPLITNTLKSSDDLRVVGVLYQDSKQAARKFIRGKASGWRLVYDQNGEVARAFDVSTPPGIPQSFFVATNGVVRARVYGEMTAERLQAELDAARQMLEVTPT